MKPEINVWILMFKSLGMLCIVLGILIVLLYVMKRFSSNKWSQSTPGSIKTLATHYIAPKEKIVLIDVLGEKILIGATPQTINTLAIINKDIEIY